MSFRNLRANEIQVRVQSVTEYGVTVLLYKDARCDMQILDETFGQFGWQRKHTIQDGINFCTVSIYDRETGQWISKEDCGSESNVEADKGASSDSFKRACVNFGIGRELYTGPIIKIKPESCNIRSGNGRFMCYDKFSVEKIRIEDHEIKAIAIWNDTKNCRAFVWQREETV